MAGLLRALFDDFDPKTLGGPTQLPLGQWSPAAIGIKTLFAPGQLRLCLISLARTHLHFLLGVLGDTAQEGRIGENLIQIQFQECQNLRSFEHIVLESEGPEQRFHALQTPFWAIQKEFDQKPILGTLFLPR